MAAPLALRPWVIGASVIGGLALLVQLAGYGQTEVFEELPQTAVDAYGQEAMTAIEERQEANAEVMDGWQQPAQKFQEAPEYQPVE